MINTKKYLKNGDLLECNQGSAPAGLVVTNGKMVNIESQPAANDTDKVAVTNVPLFGTCKILTQAANGTPTPCSQILTNWASVKTDVNIGNAKALLKSSSLPCSVGGTIKPK